jgi:molybdopterin converting factor small subunit
VARLRLLGPARDAAGTASVSLPGGDIATVLDAACELFGGDFATVLATSAIWCNGEPASRSRQIATDDEVAVLPPVSGG